MISSPTQPLTDVVTKLYSYTPKTGMMMDDVHSGRRPWLVLGIVYGMSIT